MTSESKPQAAARPEELILAMYGIRGGKSDPLPALTVQHGDGQYVGEFINDFNEVFLIWIDRRTKTGWVAGSETGWETLPIQGGRLESEFAFAAEEAAWLRLCWRTGTGEALELVETDKMNALLDSRRTSDGTILLGGPSGLEGQGEIAGHGGG